MSAWNLLLGVTACLFAAACATLVPGESGLEKVEHIVVIYAENWILPDQRF